MNAAKLKRKIYEILIDNNELISQGYARYLDTPQKNADDFHKAKEIVRLNWKYRVCHHSMDEPLCRLKMPESKRTMHPPVRALTKQLMEYDVISFDIFDTLVFRAVETPADVFRLMEADTGMIGFANMRKTAEQKARLQKTEICIQDIYEILSAQLCIDPNEWIERELQMEMNVCYANPYLYEVCQQLMKNGKTVAAVSDMYLPLQYMKRLLKKCGYEQIQEIFVSCDEQKTKGSGELQMAVQDRFGHQHSYIHIGDHPAADIDASRKIGWDACYYPNITRQGMPYRRSSMRSLAASFYKGLVNGRLHAGIHSQNAYYEYGYAYGGILAVGYCQYLKRLVRQEGFDQLLFTARDGYLLHKIYTDMFPSIDCAYIPFSRFAAYQITMEANWGSFLHQIVLPRTKMYPKEKLAHVLKVCDIEYLKEYLQPYGLHEEMYFGMAEYKTVEKIFAENIHKIRLQYKEQEKAAELYFSHIIGPHKKICIVDLGWQGTSMICIRHFLECKCGMPVSVSGALMGTANNETVLLRTGSGQLFSYLFSPQKNYDMLLRHTGAYSEIKLRNLLLEILFTEDKPTFVKYQMNQDGTVGFVYGPGEDNSEAAAAIQKGIYDFAADYSHYQKIFGACMELSGREAYMPIDALAKDKKYCLKLLGNYEINEMSGMFDTMHVRRFQDIV